MTKLTLGPIAYHWSAGTLTRERKATADFAAMETPEIEINNAAGLYARGVRPRRIGSFMNAYNEATIERMAAQGATHVCLPAELPGPAIAVAVRAARDLGIGVQVFGRASLAVSARCYPARAHGRTKDICQFVCEEDADGMPLRTRNDASILRVNGIQTQSESYLGLLPETPRLVVDGVTHLRLMPQDVGLVAVAGLFRAVLDGGWTQGKRRRALACSGVTRGSATGFITARQGIGESP